MEIVNLSKNLEAMESKTQTTVKRNGCLETTTNRIVNEHYLNIYINDRLSIKLICTPEFLTELVVGRLISGGYVRNVQEIKLVYICSHASKAKVYLHKKAMLQETVNTELTCCSGNQVFLEQFRENEPEKIKKTNWKPAWIFAMAEKFASDAKLHKETGGTHSCFLCVKGNSVFSCEDIGRHNALDKAIGTAALQGYNPQDCILFTSGRVPTDMVKKAIYAQIPILVSKSSPTTEAVEMAKHFNLALICNAWPDQYKIFNEQQDSE